MDEQMDRQMDRWMTHCTGLHPLLGLLPCYPLRLYNIKEAGQGNRWPHDAFWRLVFLHFSFFFYSFCLFFFFFLFFSLFPFFLFFSLSFPYFFLFLLFFPLLSRVQPIGARAPLDAGPEAQASKASMVIRHSLRRCRVFFVPLFLFLGSHFDCVYFGNTGKQLIRADVSS